MFQAEDKGRQQVPDQIAGRFGDPASTALRRPQQAAQQ